MLRRSKLVILAIVCLSAVGIGGTSALADEGATVPTEAVEGAGTLQPDVNGCPEALICSYTQDHFNGVESNTECAYEGAHPLGGTKESAINGCTNRAIILRTNGGVYACMNPEGERPNAEFNEIFVSSIGSRCS